MPVLIEAAADVILVLGIVVIVGTFFAIQHTFVPLLNWIGNFNTHIPHFSHPLRGITNGAVNKINAACNAAIKASGKVLAGLWTGLVWSIMEPVKALSKLASDTENALAYLVNTKIPKMIAAQIHNAEQLAANAVGVASTAANAAAKALSDAEKFTIGRINQVEKDIALAKTAAEAYAANTIASAASSLTHYAAGLVHDLDVKIDHRLDALEGSVASKVAAGVAAAERAAKTAIGDVLDDAMRVGGVIDKDIRKIVSDAIAKAVALGAPAEAVIAHAIDAAISEALKAGQPIETRIQADIARAIGSVVSVGGVTLPQVQDLIDRAVAAAAHAGGVSLADVQHLVDAAVAGAISTGSNIGGMIDDLRRTIEDEIANLDVGDVAAIGAAAAALTATLAITLAETGLDQAGCREKVKGVCGTDPLAWAGMLAGIAAFGLAIDLDEVISIGQEMVGDLAGADDFIAGIL